MFGFYFDSTYIYLILPAAIICSIAQMRVTSTFNKYSRVSNARGLTGHDVARRILDMNGLQDVSVQRVSGHLSDHYDPRSKVVRLSDSVYDSTSVAAIGVAAHETGHAVQHAVGYAPLKIRNSIIPITQFGSTLAIPLFLAGMLFTIDILMTLGIVFFSLATLFQLITLPVEFNASRRAINTLVGTEILYGDEVTGAKKVLTAAALTYVGAMIMSLMQLLRLVIIAGRRNND
ncbi:MAG: zinc metallopeptidase [Oscillospiraceae bacterium]